MKSIGEKIAEGIQKFYTAFINKRVLKTLEEVQANTNEKNIASAVVVGELTNNLMRVTDNGAIQGLDAREDGVYITYVPTDGADAVTKKLGGSIFHIRRMLITHGNTSSDNDFYFDASEYNTLTIGLVKALSDACKFYLYGVDVDGNKTQLLYVRGGQQPNVTLDISNYSQINIAWHAYTYSGETNLITDFKMF